MNRDMKKTGQGQAFGMVEQNEMGGAGACVFPKPN